MKINEMLMVTGVLSALLMASMEHFTLLALLTCILALFGSILFRAWDI